MENARLGARKQEEIMKNWKASFPPLVSVCCITYNHESFISDAIEGFLMQDTDFPFEIIIHDDASTDKTAAILKKYADQYPKIIKPIFQEGNQYSKGVRRILATFILPIAKGKYIALCEGDDYWTDPLKLQKQGQFLEDNADYSLCFHRAIKVDKEKKELIGFWPEGNKIKQRTNLSDILERNYISTQTVLYRNRLFTIDEYLKVGSGLCFGEWPLHVLNAMKGDIFFFEEAMSVYRVTHTGASHSTSPKDLFDSVIKFYGRILPLVDQKYTRKIYNCELMHALKTSFVLALVLDFRGSLDVFKIAISILKTGEIRLYFIFQFLRSLTWKDVLRILKLRS